MLFVYRREEVQCPANWLYGAELLRARQFIRTILLNPRVQYSIHNSPVPLPILSQINLIHNPISLRTNFAYFHLHLGLPICSTMKHVFGFTSYSHGNPNLNIWHRTGSSIGRLRRKVKRIVYYKPFYWSKESFNEKAALPVLRKVAQTLLKRRNSNFCRHLKLSRFPLFIFIWCNIIPVGCEANWN
jgi:hypothetical protein